MSGSEQALWWSGLGVELEIGLGSGRKSGQREPRLHTGVVPDVPLEGAGGAWLHVCMLLGVVVSARVQLLVGAVPRVALVVIRVRRPCP